MTIALDATYSLGADLSGVGVYSREILHGLAAAHPEARFRFCYRPHRYLEARRESLPPNCRRALLLDRFPPRADVYHGLNQRLPTRVRRPAVATFHDLFVLTGDYSTPDFRAALRGTGARGGGARGPHHHRLRVHRPAGGRVARRGTRAAARDSPRRAAAGVRAQRTRKGGAARGRHSAAQEHRAAGGGLRSPGAGLAPRAGGLGRLRRRGYSRPHRSQPRARAHYRERVSSPCSPRALV